MVTSEPCSPARLSATIVATRIEVPSASACSSALPKILPIVILFSLFTLPLLAQRDADLKPSPPATPIVVDSSGAQLASPTAVLPQTRSRFGLAVKASSLGVGGDFGTLLTRHFDLRAGFTGLSYSRTVADGDISYPSTLHLNSVQAVVDWFPWSRAIHFSPGLLLNNRNRVTATALVPTGKVLTSGVEKFISNPKDPITGSASSSMRKLAPMMLVGFGNIIPRSKRFSISSDLGVVFEGAPNAQFTLLGSACDPSGAHCRNAATDKSIQADVRSGETTMQNDLSFMRFYPVVSVEFGYHF